MATPEGKVKNEVKKVLKRFAPDCYYFMPVQQGYGAPSLDFIGSMEGFAFAIETKAPGKKLTARQQLTKETMEEAGMAVFVIGEEETDDEFKYSGMEALCDWLRVRATC